MSLEKLGDIIDGCRIEIFERPDERVRVVPVLERDLRPVVDDSGGVRPVIEAQAALLLYRFFLVGQILGRDVQAAHAVAFQPQADGQLVRGQHFKVVRVVGVSGTVQRAAVRLHRLEVRSLRRVGRALEHHVLE